MTRPDHSSGTERVAEVASWPEFAGYDVIVNVQGDEPYLTREILQGAAAFVEGGIYPLGTAACVANPAALGDPSVVKVVTDARARALYFSRAPIPFLRDMSDIAQRDTLVRQHIGVYAYTPAALARWVALPPHPLEMIERLEQLRAIANGLAMGVALAAPGDGGGIDTEGDLAVANARWRDTTPISAGIQ